jgi:hypothetical protein
MSISLALDTEGAIANLDDLKDWIADEVDRPLSDISDKLDKWILMAESYYNRHLRTPDMEGEYLFTADAEDMPLPSDYRGMRSIYIEGSPDRPLRAFGAASIRMEYDGTTSAYPAGYVLVSEGIRFVPPPSGEILLHMDYFKKIPSLSVVNPSNWLLEKHPDAYVAAILFHYYRWAQNLELAVAYKSMREELKDEINAASRRDRFGAGALVPNAVIQVRGARS